MSENDNSGDIKPDSTHDHVTPPPPSNDPPGVQAENGDTHDEIRNENVGEADIASVMKQVEWPMIILTAIIAIATAANVVVYWCESESSSAQTQKLISAANIQACAASKNAQSAASFAASADGINTHTKDAVDKFQRLAKASEDNISAIRESARLEQRAWISTGISLPIIDQQETKTIPIKVTLINSGKTFALKTVVSSHATFTNHEITTDEKLKLGAQAGPPDSIALLAPGMPSEAPIDISTEDLPRIIKRISGGGYTYVWGDISYFDVFKRPHTTEYCAYRKEPTKTDTPVFQCKFHTDAN
jgi:hypothetical protein